MRSIASGSLWGPDVFRTVHVAALALCAILLPWSTAFLSMAQMLLVANWLVEGIVRGDLPQRFGRAFGKAPSLVFVSFFGLHILGLAWSTDMDWGLDMVRILLPVLSFGVVLAASPRLSQAEYRTVLLLGAWSVVASTLVGLVLHGASTDYRSLSYFISHIRLSLLLCLAVVVFLTVPSAVTGLRIGGYVAAAWSVAFINELGSLQGVLILLVIGAVFLWRATRGWARWAKLAVRTTLVVIPVVCIAVAIPVVRSYFVLPSEQLVKTMERTAGGEYYHHDITNPHRENGTFVWTYWAPNEVGRTWPLRSKRSLNATDEQGHPLWSTLARYLSSKGVRKDSLAVMALTDAEIHAIESGVTHVEPSRYSGLRERVDEVGFELGQYHAYGRANGHSVTMRLEYLKAGWAIAKRHWLVGVGTGDTKQVFNDQYDRMHTSLAPEWRHRAHNEYLTLWISFGVLGLLWSLFAWWWPAKQLGAWQRIHFIAWAIIFGISCLTDDTIETQAGATFFGLYYALFVFASPAQEGEGATSTDAI